MDSPDFGGQWPRGEAPVQKKGLRDEVQEVEEQLRLEIARGEALCGAHFWSLAEPVPTAPKTGVCGDLRQAV